MLSLTSDNINMRSQFDELFSHNNKNPKRYSWELNMTYKKHYATKNNESICFLFFFNNFSTIKLDIVQS
jgi:hypothetical protein